MTAPGRRGRDQGMGSAVDPKHPFLGIPVERQLVADQSLECERGGLGSIDNGLLETGGEAGERNDTGSVSFGDPGVARDRLQTCSAAQGR